MDAYRLWLFGNALFSMGFLDLILFLTGSIIVIVLILIYLPNRYFSQPLSINSNSQTITLRLSPCSNLMVEEILDRASQINVQDQMQAALSTDVTTIRVLNVTGTTFIQRKRRHNASIVSDNKVADNIPYVNSASSILSVKDTGLPDSCQIKHVHVLHPHGSRYPPSDPFDGGYIQRSHEKTEQISVTNGVHFIGPLSFINTWSVRFDKDPLVPSGATGEYLSGANFWNQYGRILYNAQPYYNRTGRQKLQLRTILTKRKYESAILRTTGFFSPYVTFGEYSHPSISYDNRSNKPLYGAFDCCNFFVPSFFTLDEINLYAYASIALSHATTHFTAYTPSTTILTHIDAFPMQALCANEYVSSAFSSLFKINEYCGFEQGLNLAFYNSYTFGNGTGSSQQIGYVEELIARINNRLIPICDLSEETSLSIDCCRENISSTTLPTYLTPTKYSPASVTHKFIRMRLNNGILPLDPILGSFCSVGESIDYVR